MAARQRNLPESKPRSDVYTGLLIISLLAQIVGLVFFYLDWSAYPAAKPPTVQMPNLSSAASSAPATPPAVPPGGGAVQPPPSGNTGQPPASGAAPAVGGQPK